MTSQMIIRMNPEIKSKLTSLARNDGKTPSQFVSELIENYIPKSDMGSYIDDLWARIGTKLSDKGVEVTDIESVIQEVRAKKK